MRFPPTVWLRRLHCFGVGQEQSPGIDRQPGGDVVACLFSVVTANTEVARREMATDMNDIVARSSGGWPIIVRPRKKKRSVTTYGDGQAAPESK